MDYDIIASEFCKMFKGKQGRQVTKLLEDGFKGMYAILRVVRDSENEIMPIDIAKKLDISTARVAAALNSLSKKGYIRRIPALSGNSNVIVEITPSGLMALSERETKVHGFITALLKKLSENEAQTFIDIMKKLFQ